MARHHKYFEGGAAEVSTRKPNGSASRKKLNSPLECLLTRAGKSAMLKVYSDFFPLVVRMLELVPEGEVCKWKLCIHYPLRIIWIIYNFYLCFAFSHKYSDHLSSHHMVPHTPLKTRLRKARTEHLVEEVVASECALHPMDPEVQAARGEAFRQVKYSSLDCVVNREVQDFVYGHDYVWDTEAHFDGYFAEVKGK
ncbi:hypothetical protein DFH08DRAFT_816125 [Mycena albidolilacea]|uniref:Uncharacterized protein n=1 Tax=Mycena albidolilacea TaxID=1033008 RepID=A0AAD6ZL10_9AGAR|nr:hypothetical protein DFH08DRAFT_816125 [Mycena albidolilacea]